MNATATLNTSTYFALMAEFGTADIPLETVADKYFGLNPKNAIRQAAQGRLPVPAYRAASRKSPWLVNAADLAKLIDAQRTEARHTWERGQPN